MIPTGENGRTRRVTNRIVTSFTASYNTNELMSYSRIFALYSEIYNKHITALCGQNVEYLSGT